MSVAIVSPKFFFSQHQNYLSPKHVLKQHRVQAQSVKRDELAILSDSCAELGHVADVGGLQLRLWLQDL